MIETVETVSVGDELRDLIRQQSWNQLRDRLTDMHPSDVADLIIALPREEEGFVFRVLPRDEAGEVFSYLPPDHQEGLIESLSNEQVRNVLAEMNPDDRTRLLEEMPAEVTRRLLTALSPEDLKNARWLLGYPEDTAGRYMTPRYVTVQPEMTAREALDHIRRTGPGKETVNVVYIVDQRGRLVEDIRLSSLVLADPASKVVDIDDPPLVKMNATDDREEVLKAFEKYDRLALPVTDADGHMLGIITVDDVLDVAEQEATEDIQKLGGMEALDAPYLQVNVLSMIKKRAGWLSALFLGEMLTATAMSFFEKEIARAVVLALFVPLIISSGGNSGSQATSLIIRSLALRELRLRDWFRVFRREILSGLALGSLLGFIGFIRIVLWEKIGLTEYGAHYMLVALTVWFSLIGVVLFGTLAGSMLPFILRKLGFDPATASAPFVATLVDVTGLCIYFTVALMILKGTLL
ncbi:MAG: magnesium transporter [Acidobacteria bacterium]|nr:magnesium transporter [Acidobacteriota bacterium]MBV9067706.1 magnesium transporter [Acidobacteriota bacterium]MBV9185763.1 magnesium transporter [Acidobacteriota bacterium]